MKTSALALIFAFVAATGQLAPSPKPPAPGTFRLDYYHTGNAKEERFSLDRVVHSDQNAQAWAAASVDVQPRPGGLARAGDR